MDDYAFISVLGFLDSSIEEYGKVHSLKEIAEVLEMVMDDYKVAPRDQDEFYEEFYSRISRVDEADIRFWSAGHEKFYILMFESGA